jgi:hypothetical protein
VREIKREREKERQGRERERLKCLKFEVRSKGSEKCVDNLKGRKSKMQEIRKVVINPNVKKVSNVKNKRFVFERIDLY